jgi:hypothetical protein
METYMQENGIDELQLFGTTFYRRTLEGKVLRDFPPARFVYRPVQPEPGARFSRNDPVCMDPNIRVKTSQWSTAHGAELVYFTTLEEAIDYYNSQINACINWAPRIIERINESVQEMEARRIRR